ncbi:MAG: hypothetical protein D6798_09510 [Deltaproteobacteria bacterium]|nr:MAG: hypothetical protein D6798_09510 [Deltaproteobacteria bacterium]
MMRAMADPPLDPRADPARRLGLLVAIVVVVAWLPVLGAGFVWDDSVLFLDNRLLSEPGHLAELWRSDLWAGTPAAVERSGFYRPLVAMSFVLDRALTGPAAWFAHLHSLSWHLLGGAILFVLLRRVVPAAAALAGAALFLVHPAQVEAVAWVAARNDPMAAAMLLSGVAVLDDDDPRPARLLLGAACVLGALLSKESALLASVVLAAFSLARTGRPGRLSAHLAVLAALAVYGGLRAWAEVPPPARADVAHLRAAVLPALAAWCRSALWPVGLAPGVHLAWPPPLAGWALAGAAVLALALLWWGRRIAAAGLVVAGVTLAPALGAVASQGLVADRYLYLPLAGVALAVAGALARAPRVALVAGAGIALVGGVLTARTLPTWSDDETLWRTAVQRHPSQWTAGALARTLDLAGRPEAAIAWYRRAIAPPQAMQEACFRVTAVDVLLGDPEAAVADAEVALEAGCARSPELLAPVAMAHALLGHWAVAESLAAELDPDPTGLAVVVRSAAAARRQDLGVLEAAVRSHPDADPAGLVARVAWLLEQAGDASSAAWVRAAAP